MQPTVRLYGAPPYRAAVLHGGPGAPGSMAPVARELAVSMGVIEPLQARDSLEGQIEELSQQLAAHTSSPITLVGSSWGAVLALFLAARQPEQVDKLILIGCAVFDAASSATITPRRLARLSPEQRQRYEKIVTELDTAPPDRRNALMSEWGELLSHADLFNPVTRDLEVIEVQHKLHTRVWADFKAQRDTPGHLGGEFAAIAAPVVLIHGEYDPHPIDGIRPFLESCLGSLRCHLLAECGHYPWVERRARDRFFEILRAELGSPPDIFCQRGLC